jgi:hypothetical protein
VSDNSSSFMGREESTKIPNCRSKVERYLKKMGYYTTVPSPFVTKGENLMSNNTMKSIANFVFIIVIYKKTMPN